MNYTTLNCGMCGKEAKIMVGKYSDMPDKVMCKACSQGKPKKEPRRYVKRHNWTNTGKQEPTTREKAARKRIYGS